MPFGMNIFRFLADMSHLLSKCILIFSIHSNRSAEGVSLLTQALYAVIFVTRYSDVFIEKVNTAQRVWNHIFKIFYLLSSFYTVAIMRFVYPRTREQEVAWKLTAVIVGGSLLLSPFVMLIFDSQLDWKISQWLWDFSEILESVCVLPQLLLLRQTTIPTVITSFYIVFLGSYRALYILNWIVRALDRDDIVPKVSVVFGIIQTALYADFAWVYWTRQRVKLRNGGVVDADDLRRGWLLNRIFGKHAVAEDDEESAPALGGRGNRGATRAKWGTRGISISADEGVLEGEHTSSEENGVTEGVDPDARMQDPDELAKVLDEDEYEGASARPGLHKNARGEPSGVRNGEEWIDD